MPWTLEYDGEEKTLAEWGLSNLRLSWASFEAGRATMDAVGQAFDAAPLFAVDEEGILRLDGTVVFRGLFGSPASAGDGAVESVSYVIRDAWHDMEQRFAGGAVGSGVQSGNLDDLFTTAVEDAAAAGVAVQMGTAANLAVAIPPIEFRDQTFAELIRSLRRFCPDVQTRFDYTTTPPTLHFVRRADAGVFALSLTALADTLRIAPLHDLQTAGVVLLYSKMISGVGGATLSIGEDKYPLTVSPGERRVVVASFDLRGNQIETQVLATSNINALSKAWWARFFPWMNDATGSEFTVTDTERLIQDGDGDWVNDTTGSVSEIIAGAVPSWETAAQSVLVKAVARNFTLDGKTYDSFPLETTVNATSLAGGVFAREIDAGESVPIGLAQAYYEATSVLHYEGSFKVTVPEITTGLLPDCASVLNLSGGEAAARGWTTMRAVIRRVEVNVDAAQLAVSFGPPSNLAPNDLLELSRIRGRQGFEVPVQTGSSGGMLLSKGNNSVPRPAKADSLTSKPWAVSSLGVVTPGTINGVIPKIGDVPIAGFPSSAPTLTIPEEGSAVAYMRITWAITWNGGWLGGNPTISEVALAVLTTAPTDTDEEKYVPFCTFLDGAPGEPLFTKAALVATLCGNAADTTTMTGPS